MTGDPVPTLSAWQNFYVIERAMFVIAAALAPRTISGEIGSFATHKPDLQTSE
jgi:hypothetical protein